VTRIYLYFQFIAGRSPDAALGVTAVVDLGIFGKSQI
jgi:hypothetical protein